MSDIAKRLRVQVDRSERWSDDYHQDESLWAIAREAADEIERLEKLQQVYFRCGEALTEWRGRAMKAEPEAECLKVQLEDECESHRETLAERDHWKALWQGTVEYSTKIIQERDEALRELEEERESHRETAEIMRRTRERAEYGPRYKRVKGGWVQQ
ncbi:Uncharacterised protein [Mycobacteroides abscessus subsp. abscessus]|uniref:hypothetical protein n=1 Tax=Mycobacteroides abscessus TaxID=36809 RepID=UPI0009293723|nr:hypothetical protein [Mycobacteroides abscessus]SIJ95685.1 Uncharacterised protein [Mycobacteroides abscessus subsp. abscessus]